MEGFKKHFFQFVTERTEDIWRNTNSMNQGLKKIEAQQEEVCSQLEETLTEGQLQQFEAYKELVAQEITYLRHIIYAMGYKDGINQANLTDQDIFDSCV